MNLKTNKLPLYYFLGSIIVVYVIEFTVMSILQTFDIQNHHLETFLDTSILLLLASPFLYRFVYKSLKTETALRRSIEQYFNVANSMFLVLDTRQNIVSVNRKGCEILGHEERDILGRNWLDLLAPRKSRADYEAIFHKLISEGTGTSSNVITITDGKGNKKAIDCHSSVLTDDSGRVNGVLISGTDITDRVEARRVLVESEKKYRLLFEDNPFPMCVYDTETFAILALNNTAVNYYGYSRPEALSMTIKDIHLPEDLPLLYETVSKAGEGLNRAGTWRHIKKDGSVVYVEVTSQTFPFNGRRARIALANDVTERKKTAEVIYQAKQDWEDTFNSLTDMITVHDKDYNIIWANKAAQKILSLPILENERVKCFRQYHGSDVPPSGCPSCDCIKTGAAAKFDIFEPHLNMFIEISAVPRFNAAGEMVGLIHVVRDITEKKKSEERIIKQLERLEAMRAIDTAIMSSLDLRLTLDILLRQAAAKLDIDAACILIYDKFGQRLEYSAGIGFRTSDIKDTSLRLGQGCAGKIAHERETLKLCDLRESGGGFAESPLVKEEGFAAYMGMPLISKGEVKGVLEIFHRSALLPDADWMDFAETLAGQAAIAIDNSSMYNDLQRSNSELIMAYDATIEGWARALDFRDKETEGHSRRVTELTVRIARAIGVTEKEIIHIRRGALLHDIGKLGVPDSILLKPGKLTDEEWVIMKRHPEIAYNILSPVTFLKQALDVPYCHHERWDGTGYPRGLKGEQIPLSGRIFAVVDVWDALRSDRPYRSAWSEEKTIEHIKSLAGTHFDPIVVEGFLNAVKKP